MAEFTPDEIDAKIKTDPQMQHLANTDSESFIKQHATIYNSFGYNPDGTPLSKARKAIKGIADATGIPEGVVHFGASSILPTVGTIAGMAAGAPGGPAGMAVGASGGSVLGEAGNHLLGLNEGPMDVTDFGLAAGAPLVGPGVSKLGQLGAKGLVRGLPGSGAGLHARVGEELQKTLQGMRVTSEHVDTARMALKSMPDFEMPAPNLKAIFNSETAKAAEQGLAGVPGSDTYLKALNHILESNPEIQGKISFKTLMTLEEGFNRIKDAKVGEVWAAASGKIIDDLEAAANNPNLKTLASAKAKSGLEAFKSFMAINNKYKADETLVNMFTPGKGVMKVPSGAPDLVQFDQKAFRLKVDNDPALKKAFTPQERQAMKDSISELGYLKGLPNTANTPMGIGSRYGVGGFGGLMVGGPFGMVAGAGLEEILRTAVTSPGGQKAIKGLAKEGRGRVNALELKSVLGQITAGATAGSVAGIKSMPEGISPFANQE